MGMKKNVELIGFIKLQILLLLNKKEMSGYLLMREIEKITGGRPSPGHIYPLLATMKALNYVKVVRIGMRKMKMYKLTDRGKKALKHMVEKMNNIVEAVLADKLVKCEKCECVIYEHPYIKRISGKAHYFCCKSCAGESKKC